VLTAGFLSEAPVLTASFPCETSVLTVCFPCEAPVLTPPFPPRLRCQLCCSRRQGVEVWLLNTIVPAVQTWGPSTSLLAVQASQLSTILFGLRNFRSSFASSPLHPAVPIWRTAYHDSVSPRRAGRGPLPFGQREHPAAHQISLLPATGGRSSLFYSIKLHRLPASAFRGGTLVALESQEELSI